MFYNEAAYNDAAYNDDIQQCQFMKMEQQFAGGDRRMEGCPHAGCPSFKSRSEIELQTVSCSNILVLTIQVPAKQSHFCVRLCLLPWQNSDLIHLLVCVAYQ